MIARHYFATLTRTGRSWQRDRQRSGIAERNTALRSNPTQTDQLIFDKGVKSAQWGENSLSTNGLGQ